MQWFRLIWDVSSYLRRLSSALKSDSTTAVSWDQVLSDMTAFLNRAFDLMGAPPVKVVEAPSTPKADPVETTVIEVNPYDSVL